MTKIEDNIAAAYEWAQSHKPPHPRVGIKFEDFREAFLMLRCPMALSLAESEGVEMLNVFGSDEDTEFHRTLSMACSSRSPSGPGRSASARRWMSSASGST